ncbi:MAG: hypothetical protein ACXVRW_18735 [Solirubrobacteraceae bacterium]
MLLSHSSPALTVRDGQGGDLEASDAHLLRLCLDLQLDALLLTLGALSAETAREMRGPASPASGPAPVVPGGVPWRRWLSEDVDHACELAADALAGSAALPPTLGSDLGHAIPASTIDDLIARYASMLGLLEDLSQRTRATGRPARLDDVIMRTEKRLAELREHKLLATPPAGIDLRAGQQFLPGELLG